MESEGVVDRIQMSRAAADLVKEQAPELANRIHRRAGLVTPKGKTPMQTFWLFTDEDMNQVQTRGRRFSSNSEGGLSLIPEGAAEEGNRRQSSDGRSQNLDGVSEGKRRRSDGVVFGSKFTKSGSDWV